jgi:hypothetical protein
MLRSEPMRAAKPNPGCRFGVRHPLLAPGSENDAAALLRINGDTPFRLAA